MNETLFHMWGPFRQSLIAKQRFYVEQAEKRLLGQFDNISAEAQQKSDDWLAQHGHLYDPDRHESGEFEEIAFDAGLSFFMSLSHLKERTYLSVVAGMYHEWEIQLREWLTRESRYWHGGEALKQAIWNANTNQIFDLFTGLGWKVCDTDFSQKLKACGLVVNVYKHGDGLSLQKLSANFPVYLDDPLQTEAGPIFGKYMNHTNLKVSIEQIHEFSEAILAFWSELPEYIKNSEEVTVPKWFEDAL